MPKPIKLEKEHIQELQEEFLSALTRTKLFNGKVQFNKSYQWQDNDSRAQVLFEPTAYSKMIALIQGFSDEVGWHGIAKRLEGEESAFVIEDILVYPQEVTGATVTPDHTQYALWLHGHEDEIFNHIRMQGHSHVKMSVSPSSVDNEFYENILAQLDDTMFYIFMVWNKSFESHIIIYDLKNNTYYDNKEIDWGILGSGFDMNAFIEDAKSKVLRKTYTTGFHTSKDTGSNKNKPHHPNGKNTKKKKTEEKPAYSDPIGRGFYGYENYGYCEPNWYE